MYKKETYITVSGIDYDMEAYGLSRRFPRPGSTGRPDLGPGGGREFQDGK